MELSDASDTKAHIAEAEEAAGTSPLGSITPVVQSLVGDDRSESHSSKERSSGTELTNEVSHGGDKGEFDDWNEWGACSAAGWEGQYLEKSFLTGAASIYSEPSEAPEVTGFGPTAPSPDASQTHAAEMPSSLVDVDGGINFHLEDNGFNPTIIIDDPDPCRRDSHPAPNDDGDLVAVPQCAEVILEHAPRHEEEEDDDALNHISQPIGTGGLIKQEIVQDAALE